MANTANSIFDSNHKEQTNKTNTWDSKKHRVEQKHVSDQDKAELRKATEDAGAHFKTESAAVYSGPLDNPGYKTTDKVRKTSIDQFGRPAANTK